MIEHVQSLAFLSMPGTGEWIILLAIGLLIFGRRLPDVARSLGKSVNELKRGLRDFQESADEVVRDVNKVADGVVSDAKDAAGLNDFTSAHTGATTPCASPHGSPDDVERPPKRDQDGTPDDPLG